MSIGSPAPGSPNMTRAPSRLRASACERVSPIAAPISRAEVAEDCVRAKSPSQNDRFDSLARARARPGEGSGGAAPRLCSVRSEEHTSELQSRPHLVCRLLLEKKNK